MSRHGNDAGWFKSSPDLNTWNIPCSTVGASTTLDGRGSHFRMICSLCTSDLIELSLDTAPGCGRVYQTVNHPFVTSQSLPAVISRSVSCERRLFNQKDAKPTFASSFRPPLTIFLPFLIRSLYRCENRSTRLFRGN